MILTIKIRALLKYKEKRIQLMSNWDTKFLKKGFTFDDVLLIPAESHVLPNDADLSTQLASNLRHGHSD